LFYSEWVDISRIKENTEHIGNLVVKSAKHAWLSEFDHLHLNKKDYDNRYFSVFI